MPHISKLNEQVLSSFTCYTTDTTGFYKINTEDEGYYPNHQVKEYTDIFYTDLKNLLEQASANGLDISCSEWDKSFTLFGQKFYCLCIESSYCAREDYKNSRYSIVPIIYKENYVSISPNNIYESGMTAGEYYSSGSNIGGSAGDRFGYAINLENVPITGTYHTNCFYRNFNRYIHDYHMNYTCTVAAGNGAYHNTSPFVGYGVHYDYVGFNNKSSLCENHTLRKTIKYKINLYYNSNYLYITYNTCIDGYIEEFPLGFFAKGIDCLGKKVLLTTLSPTILSNGNLNNVFNVSTKMYSRISIWDIETGNNLYEQDAKYIDTFNINKYPYMSEYFGIDTNKFIKTGLQALNGLIKFDNLIVGEISEKYHTFTRGQYYKIDGEDYYIPVDAGINNLYPDKATYNGIFLKI